MEYSYPDRWFCSILRQITYKDWYFDVIPIRTQHSYTYYLQVRFIADNGAGHQTPQSGRKWLLSPHMTKSEVVQTALKAVLAAEEHEAREQFRYRERAIFGPHFDVDELVAICDKESLDVRAEPPQFKQ